MTDRLYRMAWRINGESGHGPAFNRLGTIPTSVAFGNRHHGLGSHWVEVFAGTKWKAQS